jgi:hypothetical protein
MHLKDTHANNRCCNQIFATKGDFAQVHSDEPSANNTPSVPISAVATNSTITSQANKTTLLIRCTKCNNNHLFDEVSLDLHIQEMHKK